MHRLVATFIAILAAAPLVAQSDSDLTATDLMSGGGQFDAITINGVVLAVTDVQNLIAAGLLRLDPVTHLFLIGTGLDTEARFMAALQHVSLSNRQAPRDLYRSSKVGLPNGVAHELTIPTGFGPAHFAIPGIGTGLSASFGGVSRVPYTASADGALGLGVSFGNAFDGLGASLFMSFNDLSNIANTDRMAWGMAVSHYLTDGVSLAVGGENLFVTTTDGEASYYVAGSWAFDAKNTAMPFDGVLTVGAGNGRFHEMTPRDLAEGKASHGTGVFGSLAWEVTPSFNVIAEWNGRNLNAGLGYTLPHTDVTFKLGVENLTQFSGDGPIITGSVGVTLARF